MADDDVTHVDLAMIAQFDPVQAAYELNHLIIAVMRQVEGGEVTLPPGWFDDAKGCGLILLSDPRPDGSVWVRLAPRVKTDDPRVPPGGWVQVRSGMAVHVEGVAQDGRVIVRHLLDEPGEHRADEEIESFLARHVQADAVPLIGGEANG